MKLKANVLTAITIIVVCSGCMTTAVNEKTKSHTEKKGGEDVVVKGNPAYAPLYLFTVPLDIVTSPFQLVYYVLSLKHDMSGLL